MFKYVAMILVAQASCVALAGPSVEGGGEHLQFKSSVNGQTIQIPAKYFYCLSADQRQLLAVREVALGRSLDQVQNLLADLDKKCAEAMATEGK